MPRNLNLVTGDTDPGPETQAMRPNTGLTATQRASTSALVKLLMRRRQDHLPDGEALTEADKELIYADAAHMLSGELHQPVTVDQVRLVAAAMRTPNTPRRRYSSKLSSHHHALIVAEADARGVHPWMIVRDILDAHFELSPEA